MSSMARILWKILVEKAVILAPGNVTVPFFRLDWRRCEATVDWLSMLSVLPPSSLSVLVVLRRNSMLVKVFVSVLVTFFTR